MAYWSSEKLREKISSGNLIIPYEEEAVTHCAYELALGDEYIITSTGDDMKQTVLEGGHIRIPPGQFGLLMTHETVKVSADAIAFISIRARVKFQGLINISGFHVDPGFEGKLKFAIYNAGSRPVLLNFRDRIFMIWYCDLDRETRDVYKGGQHRPNEITANDVAQLQGEVASPAALKKLFDDLKLDYQAQFETLKNDYQTRISALETNVTLWRGIAITLSILLLSSMIGLWTRTYLDRTGSPAPSSQIHQTFQILPSTSKPLPTSTP